MTPSQIESMTAPLPQLAAKLRDHSHWRWPSDMPAIDQVGRRGLYGQLSSAYAIPDMTRPSTCGYLYQMLRSDPDRCVRLEDEPGRVQITVDRLYSRECQVSAASLPEALALALLACWGAE